MEKATYKNLENKFMQTGDKVVYRMRDIPELGLWDGQEYKVLGTANCNCHYGLMIDVGIMLPEGVPFVTCSYCNTTLHTNGKYFMHFGGFEVKI